MFNTTDTSTHVGLKTVVGTHLVSCIKDPAEACQELASNALTCAKTPCQHVRSLIFRSAKQHELQNNDE